MRSSAFFVDFLIICNNQYKPYRDFAWLPGVNLGNRILSKKLQNLIFCVVSISCPLGTDRHLRHTAGTVSKAKGVEKSLKRHKIRIKALALLRHRDLSTSLCSARGDTVRSFMSDFRNFIEQKSMMTITLRVNWDIKTWVESQTLPKVHKSIPWATWRLF